MADQARIPAPLPQSMRAIHAPRYGDAAVLQQVETPLPDLEPDMVLVQPLASSLNVADWVMMRGYPLIVRASTGLFRPRDPRTGKDVAGVVVAVGAEVKAYQPGDEVFGLVRGAWADYVRARPAQLARKPEGLGFPEASCLPVAGLTALQGIRDCAGVSPGERVLIIGASGGVGHLAVQIARSLGAQVTAVCSGRNAEFVRSLGAEDVIDYTQTDYTSTGARYDVIYDLVGSAPLSRVLKLLGSDGRYQLDGGQFRGPVLGPMRRNIRASLRNRFVPQKLGSHHAELRQEDLQALAFMAEAGTVRPQIEKRFGLDEVQQAMAHLASRRTRGKVVLELR